MTAPVPDAAVVDLRSDTVTRPDTAMRRVMVEAEVGDHTLGDDPTAKELERYVAELLGKEAALFFPSGIMANQTAILVQTRPGEDVAVDADAHIVHYEEGAARAWTGVQLRPVPSDDGLPVVERIAGAIRSRSAFQPGCRLLCLENTHNSAGGRVVPVERFAEAAAVAHDRGARVHLDGARLANAAVAAGVEMRAWAEHADTVMLSLSKGLGAPIGSMLAGERALMTEAARIRRRLGGGMRQVGILAAAGLHALRTGFDRLAVDHALAADLARRLRAVPGLDPNTPDTNIVMVHVDPPLGTAARVVARLAAEGVRAVEFGPHRVRMVVHNGIDATAIDTAVSAFERVVSGAIA